MTAVGQQLNPFPWYQTMRRSSPVYPNPQVGSWSVFRYDDVQRVLSEHSTFSSHFRGPGGEPDVPFFSSLISTDPPKHNQLRALVSQAFTPKAIEQLERRIADITRQLLDPVVSAGAMDFVAELAYPLPVIVIAEMMGIPTEDRHRFKRWSDAMVSQGRMEEQYASFRALQREMSEYFLRTIQERRATPRDDLISSLIAAEIGGEKLSELDLLGFCVLLLVAGNETTTNLLGNAILCFDEHPEMMQELRSEPQLLPDAIEEVLRYRSPVQSMFRVVHTDTEMDGQRLRAGERVIAWIGSANHDETQFPDPERFDIRRSPNRHLAFGHGIHFCLGAPLARLEARVALTAVLDRMANIKIDPGATLERIDSMVVYGVKQLPITFEAA